MGCHLILKHEGLEHYYAESINELAYYPVEENAIIYQGESHWKPASVKNFSKCKNFVHLLHRVGIKVQDLFKKQAKENEYILEELDQDQDSFKAYTYRYQ